MQGNDDQDVKIMPKAIVCAETVLKGDITISSGCIIHPSATIIAEAGPIILGENCLVEEYVTIAHCRRPSSTDFKAATESSGRILSIGNSNIFEVGCTVEANCIGDKNTFECKCYVGPEVSVSNGCVIGAGVKVNNSQQLSENTVIYSNDLLQREAIDRHVTPTLQIEFLRKLLPNYHHLRKANYDPKKTKAF